jgi:hypothetical protein
MQPTLIRFAPTKLGFTTVTSMGMSGRIYFQQFRTQSQAGEVYRDGRVELVFEDSYESESDAIELFNRCHGFS